jgi:HAE1 family hydrophobic/amphiphilic exporter-1
MRQVREGEAMLISTVSIRRPVFTMMVLGAMIVFGIVSLARLGIDQFPKVDFPVITVITQLPGADPETMEMRVTDPIEEAVNTISGLKSLRSTSAEAVSQLVIEFELEKDVDVAYQEVQARINTVRQQLPMDVEEPVIEKFDVDAAPILTLVVSAELPIRELSHLADKTVKERLQRVRNVGSARIIGNRERKIWLWLDANRLKEHGLTVQDVRAALRREHVEVPGGRVETGPVELAARTKAEFRNAAEFNGMVVLERAGNTIRLKDIGMAEDGLEEERSYAQLDQTPCIALDIRRQSGTNTVQVAKDVKAEVARLQAELAPRGVRLEIAKDSSVFIERSVQEVEHHLIVGGAMAVVTVLLFLMNFRSTFISALVLPTSVLSTFILIYAMGFTINMMTLLALTLAIGMLIDDAIVVQENIMRHVEEGTPPRRAAGLATSEIGLAVLATTLSIVAVFLPVAMTRGIVGRFFWPFGLTVAFAVLISMFVSFTLDPMLSARLLRPHHGHLNPVFRLLERGLEAVEHAYGVLLAWTLRHRAKVLAIAVLCLGSVVFLTRFVKMEFVPIEDTNEFNVMVRGPQGASLAETRRITDGLATRLRTIPEIHYTFYAIGSDELQKVNEAVLYCKLTEKNSRQRSQLQLMEQARQLMADVRQAEVSVQQVSKVSGGGMKWAQLQYEVRGSEIGELERIVAGVMERMRAAGGYVDVQSTYEANKPGVDVIVDRARASDLGVAAADIADTVRAAIGGANIGKFKAEGDRYDIAVRFLDRHRDRPELLGDLRVPSREGKPVELRNVAQPVPSRTAVEISRYNRQRNITVLANLGPGKVLGPAMAEIESLTQEMGLPPGYSTGWAGQGKDMAESFRYLFETMILSVIVIFMVLAAQFESLVHPFSIMLSLPLALIGGLGSIILLGLNLSIFVMIAFIFLLGLVTKNAILLIDYTNTLRARGQPRNEAILVAGPTRLRPILMTTLALALALVPIASGIGEGAEMRQSMAIVVIGGILLSTLLTLVVIPVIYTLFDDLTEWLRRLKMRALGRR